MTLELAAEICKKYNLGKPINLPQKITGGLIHRMWLVQTKKGKYVFKELNQEIMTRSGLVENMNLCEEASGKFQKLGIKTAKTLQLNGKFVTETGGKYFIVYIYIEGKVLTIEDNISTEIVEKIGQTLGLIHKTNLQADHIKNQNADLSSYSNWQEISNRLKSSKYIWSNKCLNFIESLNSWYNLVILANNKLQNNKVFSHRDLDMKNVIWTTENEPCIIDWESAGFMNPTLELIRTALDWSGEPNGKVNEILFKSFLKGYSTIYKYNLQEIQDALYLSLLDNLAWLEFNLNRVFKPNNYTYDEIKTSHLEIPKTIDVINSRLENVGKYCGWVSI